MVIPTIVEERPFGKFGKPFYICMLTILPIVVLVVFGALVYRKIKEVQDQHMALNEDDFATNETLKDIDFRANIILGMSGVTISSLIIYSTQFVSSILFQLTLLMKIVYIVPNYFRWCQRERSNKLSGYFRMWVYWYTQPRVPATFSSANSLNTGS